MKPCKKCFHYNDCITANPDMVKKTFECKFFEDKEKNKSALEKQIPKKPNIHGYREGREINTISYTCPICNKHIGREDFCKHCGQALFWESEVDSE